MSKLNNYNGRFCESDFEAAFISYLEAAGWQYLPGASIPRASKREVLYADDLEQFLSKSNGDLTADETIGVCRMCEIAFASFQKRNEISILPISNLFAFAVRQLNLLTSLSVGAPPLFFTIHL